ncbi:hypothetical protein GQ53DRAFT_752316 [Thozetella sp. PMI_491]|nr:hypothetical protein GQ53DRAFT_752316 [Thozetella sp. PMI_491]
MPPRKLLASLAAPRSAPAAVRQVPSSPVIPWKKLEEEATAGRLGFLVAPLHLSPPDVTHMQSSFGTASTSPATCVEVPGSRIDCLCRPS